MDDSSRPILVLILAIIISFVIFITAALVRRLSFFSTRWANLWMGGLVGLVLLLCGFVLVYFLGTLMANAHYAIIILPLWALAFDMLIFFLAISVYFSLRRRAELLQSLLWALYVLGTTTCGAAILFLLLVNGPGGINSSLPFSKVWPQYIFIMIPIIVSIVILFLHRNASRASKSS